MSDEKLPPYTLEAACPKCGCDEVSTVYVRTPSYDCGYRSAVPHRRVGEHLHRTCQRCRYDWPEAVRDQPRQVPS